MPTTDDNEQESDERFTVVLSSPTAARLNDDHTGEAMITDNDGGLTMPELSIGNALPVDRGRNAALFEVTVDPDRRQQTVTVSWATADGTAAGGRRTTRRGRPR